MQQDREFYFHLGAKKAASTFFQRKVFPFYKGIHFFKKHHFNKHTDEGITNQPGKYLFSFECLEEFDDVLAEVKEHHSNLRFLYILREPSEWIASYYKYYIRKHGYKDFSDFIRFDGAPSEVNPELLKFSKTIEKLFELAPDQVLLLNFRDFKKDPLKSVRQVASFIGCDFDEQDIDLKSVNKSFSIDQLHVLKKYNRLYKYYPSQSKISAFRFIHYKYREFLLHILAFLVSFFPKSDRKLDSLISNDQLKEVKDYYSDDWAKCIEYLDAQQLVA